MRQLGHSTHPLLLLHCVLVSDKVHIEVLDKCVVTARLVADYRQQLEERLDLVPVVADVVEVALGHAACLQQLTPLQVLLLGNPAQYLTL